MKKIIVLVLLTAVSAGFAEEAVVTAPQEPKTVTTAPKIEVHGHRGTRGTRPENTLAAMSEALRVGVDVLEFDLNVTADGVVVVSHEKIVNRELCLAPGKKKIEKDAAIISLKLEELQKYDCGSIKNFKFPKQVPVPGEVIPTLAEVFDLVKNTTGPVSAAVNFNIETKITPGEPEFYLPPTEFAKAVVDVVKKYGMEERTVIQSFDWRTLAEVRKLEPKIRLSQLTEGDMLASEVLSKTEADILSPWYVWTTKEYVEAMHKAGKKVAPWTLNTPKAWEKAVEYGVDAIITDYPEELIAWLKAKGLR